MQSETGEPSKALPWLNARLKDLQYGPSTQSFSFRQQWRSSTGQRADSRFCIAHASRSSASLKAEALKRLPDLATNRGR